MGPLRRRRPVLRAAAVGGGAYALGKRHAERTAAREESAFAEQPQPAPEGSPAQPATGGPSAADIERLQELAKLRDQGVLSEQEFAQQKARILAG